MPKALEAKLKGNVSGTLNALGLTTGNQGTTKPSADAKPAAKTHPHSNLGAFLHKKRAKSNG